MPIPEIIEKDKNEVASQTYQTHIPQNQMPIIGKRQFWLKPGLKNHEIRKSQKTKTNTSKEVGMPRIRQSLLNPIGIKKIQEIKNGKPRNKTEKY